MPRYAVVAGPSFDGSWDVERLAEIDDIDVLTPEDSPGPDFYDGMTDYDAAVVLGKDDMLVDGIRETGVDVFTTFPHGDAGRVRGGIVETLYAHDESTAQDAEGGAEQRYAEELVADVLDGDQRALARSITMIENRSPGYRELVSDFYDNADGAHVIGVTGSPGAGKSTLVDGLAGAYRDAGYDVGVIAVDPVSPFTEGAVLGDRIRMRSVAGDMDVFFRSMSARGVLGGVAAATTDAVTALDAFGKDRIIVETVGAGQNEVDIARTADTVNVVVQPKSGDDVQMLKAGLLEIGDIYTVNKADLPGVDRTVSELREMIHMGDVGRTPEADDDMQVWTPTIMETVATDGKGVDDLLDAFEDHAEYLETSGRGTYRERRRHAETIRILLREEVNATVEEELEAYGGLDTLVDAVMAGKTDPYRAVDDLLEPGQDA